MAFGFVCVLLAPFTHNNMLRYEVIIVSLLFKHMYI